MTYKKRRHVDNLVEVDATLASDRIVVKNRGGKSTVYAPMPEEYLRRTRELAREWQCSEWEAINTVWKCGKYPPRDGESDIAYVKRINSMPDAPVIYVHR